MQEDDLLGNAPRRQLTNQDDLEQQLDHNYVQEDRDLKNKILFSIQGLGGIRAIQRQGRHFEAYIKGQHCEEAVRDLVKFIRRDSPYNPKTRIILAEYNIIESDLLKLLPLQVDDKKLSFWIIALLALLTAKPIDDLNPDEHKIINDSLRAYKQSFIDRQCFEILIVHMADFYKTPQENRTRAHVQMQEFIILLIRNLSQIPNDPENPRLHNHFLAALIKEEIMHPILYIIQNDHSSFRQRIDIPLLEILYHFFTCFDPETIYPSKKNPKNAILTSILSNRKTANLPSRHSRFLPHFSTNTLRGTRKLVFKIPKQQAEQEDPFKGQRKTPVRMTDYKKVIPLELQKFSSDFMTLHLETEGVTKTLGEIVTLQIEQFLEVEFQILVKLIFDQIHRQTAKVTDNNVIQYLLLCSWALQMVRARYHNARMMAESEQERSQVKFELSWVVQVMQNAHFNLIYKTLYQQVTHQKKKMFKINLFNAAIKLFSSYLDVVDDISSSMNMSDRKNANVLMANIFRHDIARILRSGFQLVSHEGIISNLVKLTHKFFKLLSVYSDGKVLTMTTNRMLKRKKKHYSDEEGELEMDRGDSDEEGNEKKQPREEESQFQERKYNEKSQFAVLAEYAIISKYLSLLKNQRFLSNQTELNQAIFFYFFQIKKLLQGEWLFYQAETLCIFQLLLSNHEWIRSNRQKGKFIQGVCLSFIKLLRKNELALVESLFKYNSLSLKDQILKNYQEGYDEVGQPEENMFTDD